MLTSADSASPSGVLVYDDWTENGLGPVESILRAQPSRGGAKKLE